MPIRRYLLLILGTVAVCLLFGNVLVSYGLVRPHFTQLETEEAHRDNVRAVSAVADELHQLRLLVKDWAVWDDSHHFMSGRSVSDYMTSNLTPEAFRLLEIDYILFIALGGEVVWSGVLDRASGEINTEVGDDVRTIQRAICPAGAACTAFGGAGLIALPGRIALAATSPILTSLGRGPTNGTIAFARILDGPRSGRIAGRAQVRMRIEPVSPQEWAQRVVRPGAASGEEGNLIMETHSDTTVVQFLLPGLNEDGAFRIITESPRRIGTLGDRVVALALAASVAVLMAVGAMAIWLIEFKVVQPAHRLAQKFSAVRGESYDKGYFNSNEFEIMDFEFDRTLSALREIQQKFNEMNYYAGMGEMFSGMAHNLRNTLMPMSLHIWQLRRFVAAYRDHIDHTAGMTGNVLSVPLGKEDGVTAASDADVTPWIAHRQEIERILDLLEAQVMDMDQTLHDHHVFSKYGRSLIPTCIRKIVDDAAMISTDNNTSNVVLRLLPELDCVSEVRAHPVILKQVIGNLMMNAREAIIVSGREHGEIVIGAENVTVGETGYVCVRIVDNGIGITSEAMNRLFERGYSTKRKSSGGIGLHWCANVVSAMDGSLRAESAGPGRGATFTVTLRAV